MQRITHCFFTLLVLSLIFSSCDDNQIIPGMIDPLDEDPIDSTELASLEMIWVTTPGGTTYEMSGEAFFWQRTDGNYNLGLSSEDFDIDCDNLNNGLSGHQIMDGVEVSVTFRTLSSAASPFLDLEIPVAFFTLGPTGDPDNDYQISENVSGICAEMAVTTIYAGTDRLIGSFTGFAFKQDANTRIDPDDPTSVCDRPGAFGVTTIAWDVLVDACL